MSRSQRMGIVPRVKGLSRAQIEQDAYDFLARYYPIRLVDPGPLDVIDAYERILYDHFQLKTYVEELEDGVEGITKPNGEILLSVETYRAAVEEEDGRARYTVMHEVYHGIKHVRQLRDQLKHSGQVYLYRGSGDGIPIYQNPEWQADEFASAVLMPSKMVKQVIKHETLWLVNSVMDVFKVSRAAAKVRLKKLGIIAN